MPFTLRNTVSVVLRFMDPGEGLMTLWQVKISEVFPKWDRSAYRAGGSGCVFVEGRTEAYNVASHERKTLQDRRCSPCCIHPFTSHPCQAKSTLSFLFGGVTRSTISSEHIQPVAEPPEGGILPLPVDVVNEYRGHHSHGVPHQHESYVHP